MICKHIRTRARARKQTHTHTYSHTHTHTHTGDFNSLPGTRVYTYLTTDAGYTSAYASLFRLAALHPTPPPPPPAPPATCGMVATGPDMRNQEAAAEGVGGGGGIGVAGGNGVTEGIEAHARPLPTHVLTAGGRGGGGEEGQYEPEFSNFRDTFTGVVWVGGGLVRGCARVRGFVPLHVCMSVRYICAYASRVCMCVTHMYACVCECLQAPSTTFSCAGCLQRSNTRSRASR